MAELGERTREYLQSFVTPAKGWYLFLLLALVISAPLNIAFSGWPLWMQVFVAISAVAFCSFDDPLVARSPQISAVARTRNCRSAALLPRVREKVASPLRAQHKENSTD
jgi:hypothetical protein